jgi:catechol 2,3-dioxygenase-like lactoylglutathione lyase family enzyme
MSSQPPSVQSASSQRLGPFLQGVQHVGVTVDDMQKSLSFYVDILGGKVALAGTGFYGDVLQNTLFQKEQLDALERGIDPRSLGVPQIRDNSRDALDVVFISFGNTCVELLHFRDAHLDQNAPNTFPKIPPGVGHGNAGHISFHVKDDVDLNRFSRMLEDECREHGIDNVICNTIIDVKSHAERRGLPLKYWANKFWREENPDYFVEGYSDGAFGDFEGWSLFYCKGPNGEQLEFNQVTRTAKTHFDAARQSYNKANGTNFEAPRGEPVQAVTKLPGGRVACAISFHSCPALTAAVTSDREAGREA